MSDEPFYSPTRKPAAPRQPKPGEPLWQLRKDHVTWSAELRFHGESFGWEAQILRNGELAIGRRFVMKAQAIEWAESLRSEIEKGAF